MAFARGDTPDGTVLPQDDEPLQGLGNGGSKTVNSFQKVVTFPDGKVKRNYTQVRKVSTQVIALGQVYANDEGLKIYRAMMDADDFGEIDILAFGKNAETLSKLLSERNNVTFYNLQRVVEEPEVFVFSNKSMVGRC